jgi:hypothetical protein
MAYSREQVIKSVLGFKFDSRVTYIDENGEEKVIEPKCRVLPYMGKEQAKIGTQSLCRKFFTNFDESLLQKIRDYQSKNY